MKTMNVSRSLILSLTLLTLIPQFLSVPMPLTLPFHKEIEVTAGQPGQDQDYYALSLAGLDGHDLLVSVVSQWGTAPKVFISREDNHPMSVVDSAYSSTSSSGSVILIKNADLQNLQNLYMTMACSLRSCKAYVNIEWTKEIAVSADAGAVTHKDDIKGLSSAIVKLSIPQVVDANRIIIHVDAISTDKTQIADINMLVGVAPIIPTANQAQNIPRSAWYEGRTAVIYQGNSLFCTQCEYLLNLQFAENTELRIEAHVFSEEMKLTFRSYLDGVQANRFNSYYHQVTEKAKEKDLVISLQAQEGSVKVYIDCAVSTDQYQTFRWKYDSVKANEQIVLTAEEHAKCQDRKYTILVFGVEDSVYSIKAAARQATNLQIRKDAPVMGTIMPQEEIDYELFVPVFLTEKVSIKFKSPGNVEMFVLNCRFMSECPNTLIGKFEHVDVEGAVEPTSFTYLAAKENDIISVTLDMEKNGCYGLLVKKSGMLTDEEREGPVCAFKIVIRSQDSNPADYTLWATVEGHQLLYPGIAEKGVVYADETVYYMLHVQQEHLMKLQFQLTVLSGHAKVFVSRKNQNPNATEEASIAHEGVVVYDNLEQYNGTYYIAIQGTTTSSYMLTPTVISSNSQPIDYATLLEEGIAHKGVIVIRRDEYPEQFYKFKVNLQENFKGKIKITVAPMRGSLLITVNNDENIPTATMAHWISKNHTLEIYSNDSYFERQNIYHVGLYLNLEDPSSVNLKEITFTISYTVISSETDETGADTFKNKNHMMLTTSFPHHGVIQAGHIMYFKALIHPSDTPITLFKQASSGDIDIYLSTDPNNQYPDANNYKLSTVTTRKNELTVKEADLDPSCTSNTDNSICDVYFSISTSSSEQVPFTLSLYSHAEDYSNEIKAVPLEDGKEREIKLPSQGRPVYFYFYPTPQENVFIDVSCPSKEITIYANYERVLTETNSQTNPTYPSNTEAMTNSLSNEDDLHSGTAHLAIPMDPDSKTSLVVTIAVYFADSARPGSNNTGASTFSIVASSHTRHIYPGKAYRGKVEADAYLYYMMNVPKANCTLFITLTNIDDGDSDLFVAFSDYERPTKDDHKFASSSAQRTEVLEINLLDIYPHESMKGKWVIGVYGKKKGSFTLTASYEGQKTIQLQQGIPVELYLKKNNVMYFKYFHDKNNSFDIRVDKQSGNLGVYINALDPRENISSVLPNSENSTWSFSQDKQSFLKIETSDPNFCSDCLYIIGVEVIKGSKFSVLITEVGGITFLQSSLRYSDKLKPKEKKEYMLVLKNADELTLSASISAGKLDIYAHNNLVVNSTINIWQMHLNPAATYEVLTMKKEEFTSKQHVRSIWNGEQYVTSQENVFYFDFENPGNVATEFSFSMQPPNTSIVLLLNEFHDFIFKAEEERSFFYSSPHVSGSLNIELKFCFTHNDAAKNGTHNASQESFSETLTEIAEGFDSEINFWTQQESVGVGSEISVIKDDIVIENIQNVAGGSDLDRLKNVCVKQLLEIEEQEQEGHYEFIFTNPYAQELDVTIRLDSTELNYKSVDRNYNGVEHLEIDEKRTYQITYTGDGYAYLDFFACSGIVSVTMGDSLEAIHAGQVQDIIVTQFGRREYFMKNKVDSTTKKYFVITTHEVSKTLGDLTADVMISTSYFPTDTGEYMTKDPHDTHGVLHEPQLTHDYNFNYEESSLTLNFKSFEIPDATSEHSLLFYIRLCPKGVIANWDNYCVAFNNPEECYVAHQSSSANEVKTIQQKFQNVVPGDYELHIAASMMYEGNTVRPFAYKMQKLSVGEPVLNKIWDILLFFIVVALIIVCLAFGFRKLRRMQLDQGYDMKVFKKTRNYGFVGEEDDDDDDDGKIEIDKEKEENI